MHAEIKHIVIIDFILSTHVQNVGNMVVVSIIGAGSASIAIPLLKSLSKDMRVNNLLRV